MHTSEAMIEEDGYTNIRTSSEEQKQGVEDDRLRLLESARQCRDRGKYEEAEKHYIALREHLQRALGDMHPDFASCLDGLASVYKDMGRYEDALQGHESAYAIRQQVFEEDHHACGESHHNIGVVCLLQGKLPRAESSLEQACSILLKSLGPEDPSYAASLDKLAEVHLASGKCDRAEEMFKKAYRIRLAALGDQDAEVAQSLKNLAFLYCRKDLLKKALPFALQASEIWRLKFSEEHPLNIEGRSQLVQIYFETGEYSKAAECQHQVCESFKKSLGSGHATYHGHLSNLGSVYLRSGEYDKAAAVCMRACELIRQSLGPQHFNYAASLLNAGAVHAKIGNFDGAQRKFQEVADRMSSIDLGHPIRILAVNNLATIHRDMGEYAEAEETCRKVLSDPPEALATMPKTHGLLLETRGVACAALGCFADAEKHFSQASELLEQVVGRNHPDFAMILSDMAKMNMAQGDFELAHGNFEMAQQVRLERLGTFHQDYAIGLMDQSTLMALTDKFGQAVAALEEAAATNRRLLRTTLPALPVLKRVDLIAKSKQAAALLPLVLCRWRRKLGQAAAATLGFCEIEQRCFGDLVQLKGWLFKMQADEAKLRQVAARPLSESQHQMYTQLAEARQRLVDRALRDPDNDPTKDGGSIESCMEEVERLEACLGDAIKASRGTEGGEQQSPQLGATSVEETVSRLAAALPPGAALVEFVKTGCLSGEEEPSRYIAFVLANNADGEVCFQLLDLAPAAQVEEKVQVFLACLQKPLISKRKFLQNFLPEGMRLRQWLWEQPVQALRNAGVEVKHVFVVPDAVIVRLPFYALPIAESTCLKTCRYVLHQDITISYLLSGMDLLRHKSANRNDQSDAAERWSKSSVVFASPDPDERVHDGDGDGDRASTFDFLAGAVEEGDVVKRKLSGVPGHSVRLLVGQEATANALKTVQAPPVLHIATHGFFVPACSGHRYPELSACVAKVDYKRLQEAVQHSREPLLRCGLTCAGVRKWQHADAGQDGEVDSNTVVTGVDVLGMDLRGTLLAVLAACDTGLGDIWRGQGVAGLCRALQVAGAETVLVSQWKMHDKSGVNLMDHFYDRFLTGACSNDFHLAEALRDSQRELFQQCHEPRIWGTFVLHGCVSPVAVP